MRFNVLALLVLLAISPNPGVAQNARVIDLRELQLKVSNTQVLQDVPTNNYQFKVTAEKGFRIVAVTLTGTLPAPGRVAFAPVVFAARYDEKSSAGPSIVAFTGARLVAVAEGDWAASFTTDYTRVVPVTIRVAFILPEAVSQFNVLIGTAAGADVKVP